MTPLASLVRDILSSLGPLSPEKLRRELRLRGTNHPTDRLERELRQHGNLFRPTGTGSWDLAENLPASSEPASTAVAEVVDPLFAGAITSKFVVVDIETTGTDPNVDEIVQIAAVIIEEGVPTRGFNRYTRTVQAKLSDSLRVRMGWEHVDDALRSGVDLALSELEDFVGELPVLAWNAHFEEQFFAACGLTFPALIDGLAVAMLAVPVGPHRLTEIAKSLGLSLTSLPSQFEVQGDDPRQFAAHDALFDCYLSGLVHSSVVDVLRQGVGDTVAQLLPELQLVPDRPVVPLARPIGSGTPAPEARDNLRAVVRSQGREHRRAQETVAELAQAGLQGRSVLVEAPTGTGKTLAYLSAALAVVASGQRVALVTAFKNLQDQLVHELREALESLHLDIGAVVLKGGDNYFCSRRLRHVIERLGSDDLDLRFVAAVLSRLVDTVGSATKEDVSWWLMERIPRARSVIDEVAVACQHPGCGRSEAIAAANRAQLVILNQVLWLQPPSAFELPTTAVLDEAHDLEDMATLASTESVGAAELLSLANRLEPSGRPGLLDTVARFGPDVSALRLLVRRIRAATAAARLPLARFASAISSDVDLENGGRVRLRRSPNLLHPAAWTSAADSMRDIRDALTTLAGALAVMAGDGRVRDELVVEDLWDLSGRARDQEDLLWRLTAVRETSLVHYLEVDGTSGRDWQFARAPIEVAEVLKPIWESLNGFVLISATLQTGANDFSFVVDRLGLGGALSGGCHSIETDFPFDQRVLFGLSRWFESIPTKRFLNEFVEETAAEVASLARFGDGRQLALFTARSRLEAVGDSVAEPLANDGIPVLRQGHGPKASLLEEFRSRRESILLGTRSFWQGVDVPGDALSFLVVEKLPYPHLRDPIVEARLELIRRRSGSEFDDYLLPQMIIAFKQGFGRLIRARTDEGVVLLLDRRLHVKPYQRRVFDALPGFIPRDLDAERDRRRFYERIVTTFPTLISEAGRRRLDELPPSGALVSEIHDLPLEGSRAERRPQVIECMKSLFGDSFDDFKSAEQEELFWQILDGEDVIGLLPTGAGKSLPFQLAALARPGVTLVVSPLVALMRDQVESLLDKGIRSVGALVGAMAADERDEVLRHAATGRIRLLYVAPERLRDPVFLDRLANLDVRRVVVDEAHCVSLWGPSFRPDFLAIRPALDAAGHHHVPIAALTATATPDIERDMRKSLRLEGALKVSMPFARPELRLAVVSERRGMPGDRISNGKQRIQLLIRILTAAERRGEAAIVYVPTIRQADQITTQLRQIGLLARAYHGKLDAWSRQDVEELFREGEIDVVVATKAFGMGIDRSDVRYVIHVGHPADLESYYQEAGRAGRDGRDSYCILLTLDRDRSTQEWFIEQVGNLDRSLGAAYESLSRLGAGTHLVDLEDFTDDLRLEDETQARVVLHYLEASGLLTRHTDQTVRARALLLGDVNDVELAGALRRLGAEPFVGFELDVLALASSMGLDAATVEQRLLSVSRSEQIVYRPIQRAAVIEVHPDAPGLSPDTTHVVSQMHKKLNGMTDYAASAECRQVTIRRYLGELAPGACGVCDICSGAEYPRPWMEIPRDTLPNADRLFDVALTVLAGIDWNAAEVDAGRNPYGRLALGYVLAADRFNLGRYVQGHERARRVKRAEASPYWGALALVTNPGARIDSAVEALIAAGEVSLARHAPTGGSGVTPYEYLCVTEAGRTRLDRGLVEQ